MIPRSANSNGLPLLTPIAASGVLPAALVSTILFSSGRIDRSILTPVFGVNSSSIIRCMISTYSRE
ncbi:hypothetical protein D3C87_1864980 [compost metagenome]